MMKGGITMFCPKCGASLPDGTAFCTSCGQSLGQQAAPQQPQQAYQQPQHGYQQPQQGYQQPYQQQYQQQYQAPVPELPTQPFTTKGIIDTFIYNVTKPKLWGIPQFIVLGGLFFYFLGMFLPYVSYGIASANYYSVGGASHIIPSYLMICMVACFAFIKNSFLMITAGAVIFFNTLFTAVGGSNLSVGFVFMLLGSIAALAGGIYQLVLEMKK